MESCFPAFMAIDVFETVASGEPRSFFHFLKSENTDGIFQTKARLIGVYDGKVTLNLSIDFEGMDGETGLPYNVFALLATDNQNVVSLTDFTVGCTSPPLAVFMGGTSPLAKVTMDERSRGASFHIVVWGR